MALSSAKTWLRDIVLLTLSIAILFGSFLGSHPLTTPDEGRYAEISREMTINNDYVTPRLNNIKYFEKPPFVYWSLATSLKTFGINEWAVRIPNALIALLGCLATYAAGRKLFDRQTGLIASIVLATNILYFVFAHTVTLDMTVSVWLSIGLFAFLCATQYPLSKQRRSLLYLFYSCTALAVLSKGLIGMIFPTMIIGAWIILRNDWQILRKIYLPSGILIFLLIAAPWHILMQLKNPEFFDFYFIQQHFLRYLTQESGRYQPIWFWIPIIFAGLLPWSTFLPQAIYQNWPRDKFKHNKNNLFLLLWIGLIFVFFSLSNSKLVPYILPIFPPLAIIVGHYLAQHWQQPTKGITTGYFLIPAIVLILMLGGVIFLYCIIDGKQDVINLTIARHALWMMTTVWLGGTLLGLGLFLRRHFNVAFAIIALSGTVALATLFRFIPLIDAQTTKSMALILKPLLKPNSIVVTYENFYQDLPFYLNRNIIIVNWQGELTFGMNHQNIDQDTMPVKKFWHLWHNKEQIFMMTSINTYQKLHDKKIKPLHIIAATHENTLLTNKP